MMIDMQGIEKLENILFFYIINFRSMYSVIISYNWWIIDFPSACREYMFVTLVPVSLDNLMKCNRMYDTYHDEREKK